jgi:cyclophilin family peptidyl-prolyl cis-trans isomerase
MRTQVHFTTNFMAAGSALPGHVVIQLFNEKAPITVANFLSYVNNANPRGDFDGTIFHRLVPGFVLQGGLFEVTGSTPPLAPIPVGPRIQNEFNPNDPERSNVAGTVAMAKLEDQPNSATSQFFFNLGNNAANLDNQNGGFTVFGKVVEGWDAVLGIAALPRVSVGGSPAPFQGPVPEGGVTISQLIRITETALGADYSMNAAAQPIVAYLGLGVAQNGLGGTDSLAGMTHATGGAGDDAILGSGAGNRLSGGAGKDNLFGGEFNPDGSPKAGSGADILQGGDGDDGLFGMDGNDWLRGGAGLDGLVGGGGDDSLEGGDGSDFLFGGDFAANGAFQPNSGNDGLKGGAGVDGLWGFDGDDPIQGEAGDDYIEGGLGADTLDGGADADTILAQAGADIVTGGAGFDYLYGGAGADIFDFNKGDSYDTAWDFAAPEGDKLRLDPALGIATFDQFKAALTGFSFDAGDGRGLVAYSVLNFAPLGSNDQITLGGIAVADWTAAMVEFG